MAKQFNIVDRIARLTNYPIPREKVEDIVEERGLKNVKSWSEVSNRDRNLALASILFHMWTSPSNTGSKTKQHGDFSITIGGVILTDKDHIFELMNRIWQNPDAELPELMQNLGGCQWIDVLC